VVTTIFQSFLYLFVKEAPDLNIVVGAWPAELEGCAGSPYLTGAGHVAELVELPVIIGQLVCCNDAAEKTE